MNFGGNVLDGNNHASQTPEAISKAVACLPAGQMFELMTQMKGCIQNNPIEARTMLAKNPQLTYALLQAQIFMNIIDPKDFMTTVTSTTPNVEVPTPVPSVTVQKPSAPAGITKTEPVPVVAPLLLNSGPPQPVPAPILTSGIVPQPVPAPQPVPVPAPLAVQAPAVVPISVQPNLYNDTDFRTIDPRLQRANTDQDLRNVSRPAESSNFPMDPRQRPPEVARNDPRLAKAGIVPTRPPPVVVQPSRQNISSATAPTSDQDKTALIMQVLQLSDEQIALLPPEQRSSILLLKEQIARTTQR